jgi:lysine decarboxylase
VLSGLVLAGLVPVWLPVEVHPLTGAPLGVAPDAVRAALTEHPRAVAVVVTEPSYQGTIGDVAGVVRAGHEHGVPVVVDQAWGAHLGMADGMPPHALELGADALVTSAHKMLPAYSQAALVAVQGARLDLDRVDRAMGALETTSPTSSVLASIDAARAFLASGTGRGAIGRTADLVAGARERLGGLGLLAPGAETYGEGRVDPLKLFVHLAAAGRDGLAIEDALLERGIPVEMADRDALVAQVGLLDDEVTIGRLLDGIEAAVAGPPGPAREVVRGAGASIPPQRMTPRAAYFAGYDVVPLDDAVGRVSAELVAPYPPGVPLLVPGEEVTAGTIGALHAAVTAGTRIAYAADPGLATLHVVRTDA